MPFVQVYIHFVWSTKNRYPYLDSEELRLKVWNHMRENAKSKDIFVDFINGHSDHCHCLISMGVDQTIQKTMQLIKGESAYWINKQSLLAELPNSSFGKRKKFEWQDEYYAASVSPSAIAKVRNYIRNQEKHHKKKTFQEELDEFIDKFGLEIFKDFG
jgi:REP element-mobilizing transposase RayT